MTVHNYRLICPNGLFYNKNGICEKCVGGKEWYCIRYNCEEILIKSIGYALRNTWSRIMGYYSKNVNVFLCLTDFQKDIKLSDEHSEFRWLKYHKCKKALVLPTHKQGIKLFQKLI